MQLFRCVSVVLDLDNDTLTLGEAQQRPRELAIINLGRDCCIGTEFDQTRADADRIVCASFQGRPQGRRLGSTSIGQCYGVGG
jgi:hypothetical protein